MPKVVSRSAVSSSTDGELGLFLFIFLLTLSFSSTYCIVCRCTPRLLWVQVHHSHLPSDWGKLDCICGEFIVCSFPYCLARLTRIVPQLVIDKTISSLPKRKTDASTIIRSQDSDDGNARVFKLNAVAGDPILLERCRHHNLVSSYMILLILFLTETAVTKGNIASIARAVRCPLATNPYRLQ